MFTYQFFFGTAIIVHGMFSLIFGIFLLFAFKKLIVDIQKQTVLKKMGKYGKQIAKASMPFKIKCLVCVNILFELFGEISLLTYHILAHNKIFISAFDNVVIAFILFPSILHFWVASAVYFSWIKIYYSVKKQNSDSKFSQKISQRLIISANIWVTISIGCCIFLLILLDSSQASLIQIVVIFGAMCSSAFELLYGYCGMFSSFALCVYMYTLCT